MYEQEAERVATAVIGGRNPRVVRTGAAQLQQRGEASAGATAPPIVHDVLQSTGDPLDAGTRAFMEPRFGHDFSRVRVHTDTKAAASARAVDALAYTVGQDVVFGAEQYAPGTQEGKKLLAHELAHTIQQLHAPFSSSLRPPIATRLGNTMPAMIQRQETPAGTEEQKVEASGTVARSWLEALSDKQPEEPSPEVTEICKKIQASRQSVRLRFLQNQSGKGFMYIAANEKLLLNLPGKEAKQFRAEHSDSAELATAASSYKQWLQSAGPSERITNDIEPSRRQAQESIWRALSGEGDASAINTYDVPNIENVTWGRGFATSGGQLQNVILSLFSFNSDARTILLDAGVTVDKQTKEFIVVDTENKYKARGRKAQNILRFSKELLSLFINIAQGTFLNIEPQRSENLRQAVLDAQLRQVARGTGAFPDFVLNWNEEARALVAHNIHYSGTTWQSYKGIKGDLKSVIRRIGELWGIRHEKGVYVVPEHVTENRLIRRAGGIALRELDGPLDVRVFTTSPGGASVNPETRKDEFTETRQFEDGKVYFHVPGSERYYLLRE